MKITIAFIFSFILGLVGISFLTWQYWVLFVLFLANGIIWGSEELEKERNK